MPGILPQRLAARDALNVWAWQHLNKFPCTWFSERELARVIREQYACEPPLVSGQAGRNDVIHDVLCYLQDRGEAVMRMSTAADSSSGRPRREWRATLDVTDSPKGA